MASRNGNQSLLRGGEIVNTERLQEFRRKLLSISAEGVMRELPQKIIDLLYDALEECDQILAKERA